jgi:hypothetical protein
MGDQNLLSRAPPCCGRHVKPLVPAAFAVKLFLIAQSLSQHDERHVVPTPPSGIRVGRGRLDLTVPGRAARFGLYSVDNLLAGANHYN